MIELFAISGDPDKMLCSVVSDLGLHCLSITLLGASRLKLVNGMSTLMGHFVLSSRERETWDRRVR